jgi:catechol 2,3-dioxygenase-like lactoylglutathione lyase family enzyme
VFQGLRTVIYAVADLEKAKDWYSQVLSQQPYFFEPFYVGFNVGGFELGLDPDTSSVKPGNNAVAYWGVSDAKAAYAHLLGLGAREKSHSRRRGRNSGGQRPRPIRERPRHQRESALQARLG